LIKKGQTPPLAAGWLEPLLCGGVAGRCAASLVDDGARGGLAPACVTPVPQGWAARAPHPPMPRYAYEDDSDEDDEHLFIATIVVPRSASGALAEHAGASIDVAVRGRKTVRDVLAAQKLPISHSLRPRARELGRLPPDVGVRCARSPWPSGHPGHHLALPCRCPAGGLAAWRAAAEPRETVVSFVRAHTRLSAQSRCTEPLRPGAVLADSLYVRSCLGAGLRHAAFVLDGPSSSSTTARGSAGGRACELLFALPGGRMVEVALGAGRTWRGLGDELHRLSCEAVAEQGGGAFPALDECVCKVAQYKAFSSRGYTGPLLLPDKCGISGEPLDCDTRA
jgi:hypothetical protein